MTQTTITQNELKALLERWAALEPEWCKAPDEDRVHFGVRAGKWKESHDFTAVVHTRQEFTSSHSWHEGAALLKSLADAIAAKSWDMTLHFTAGTDGEAIGFTGEVDIHRVAPPSFWQVFHAEPAIALLSAYVAALEAEAKRAAT